MPVIGLGIDVVDIERFIESLERTPGLRERLFTSDEAVLHPASLAARFAAKEAMAKALGAPGGLAGPTSSCVAPSSPGPTISAPARCTCRSPTTPALPPRSWCWRAEPR